MITVKWDKNRHLTVTPHRIIAVEHENEAETVLFSLPKVINDKTLSNMTASFASINSSGSGNVEVLPMEVLGSEITLKWQVTRTYTSVPGSLKYEIIFSDGDTEYRTVQDFFIIEPALNAEDEVTQQNPTILNQMLQIYGKSVDLYNALDVHIGTNGHWYVRHNDTGIPACISIQSASIGENGHLYLTLTDGTQVDAGYAKGEKGDTATISIGTVRNGETASVVNMGTPTDAILSFTLPRGLQGEPGRNFTLLSLYPTLAELQSVHPAGSPGDAYAVGTESANTVYIWDVSAGRWTSLGALFNTERLEEQLGVIPIDGGDFFEDYYNLDVAGGEF